MPSLTKADYAALAEVRYEIRLFLSFSEKMARSAGIKPQQHQLLLAVRSLVDAGERATIGVLAERLQLRHHSAVELADRCVKGGLLRRLPKDGREVAAVLTPRGARILEKLSVAHRDELRLAAPRLVSSLQAIVTS